MQLYFLATFKNFIYCSSFISSFLKPVIATIAVMTFVGKWNSWYESLLYIDDYTMVSLQYFLQRMMKNIALIKEMNSMGMSMTGTLTIPSETARMAMAILVAGPILFVFPFFQK